MPIYDMRREGDIFFAREVGDITRQDAEKWMAQLRRCAMASATPIAVLIDARDVTFIAMDARMVFARSALLPNVKTTVIVVDDPVAAQFARMIALLSGLHHPLFNTLEEARRYLQTQLVSVPIAS